MTVEGCLIFCHFPSTHHCNPLICGYDKERHEDLQEHCWIITLYLGLTWLHSPNKINDKETQEEFCRTIRLLHGNFLGGVRCQILYPEKRREAYSCTSTHLVYCLLSHNIKITKMSSFEILTNFLNSKCTNFLRPHLWALNQGWLFS